MEFLGIVASSLGAMVVMIAWRSFVLVKLWAWFVVTTFGAAPITKAQAYGLVLVLSVAHQQKLPEGKKDQSFPRALIVNAAEGLLIPAMALLTGYVIRGLL